MTRSSNTKVLTPFVNPERKFQSRKDITPIAVHNIYSFYESESSETELEDLSDIDIETLTCCQEVVGQNSIRFTENLGRVKTSLHPKIMSTFRLTAIEALESIQEKADHSHIWHKEESDKKTSNKSLKKCNDCWKRWKSHKINYHDYDETHYKRQELCKARKLPVCNMRRFKMIKYSFGQDEEYVAIKEVEYDDLVKTSNDACRTYQEIFRMMDEGWM
ncbi:hypothetical protein Tco_0800984, partial [Tanacetum coccineum]